MNHITARMGYLLFAGALSLPLPMVALYQARVEDIVASTIDDFSKNRQIELPQGCTLEATRRSYNTHFQEIYCPDGLAITRTLGIKDDGSGTVSENILQNGVGREVREYTLDQSGYYNYASFEFCTKTREKLSNPFITSKVSALILAGNNCNNSSH